MIRLKNIKNKKQKLFILVVLIALGIRLIPAFLAPAASDTMNMETAGKLVSEGKNLYVSNAGIYPYPPLWMGVEGISYIISNFTGINFAFLIKLPAIFSDIGIMFLLYLLSRKRILPALLYGLLPFSIFISGFHGQFDSFALFFVLLGVLLLQKKRFLWSNLSLGFAILIKLFPVFVLPFFIMKAKNWKERVLGIVLALAPVILVTLPFIIGNKDAVNNSFINYNGVGDFGLGGFARAVDMIVKGAQLPDIWNLLLNNGKLLFFAAAFFASVLLAKNRKIMESISIVFFLFLIFIPNISIQYFLWVIPFIVISYPKFSVLYNIVISIAAVAFYTTFHGGILSPFIITKEFASIATPIYPYMILISWLLILGWTAKKFIFTLGFSKSR